MTVAAAICLMLFPDRVSRTLLSGLETPAGVTSTAWTADELLSVLLAATGVFFTVLGVIDLVYWAAYLADWKAEVARYGASSFTVRLHGEQIGGILSSVVELVLGIVLVVRTAPLVRLIHWLRSL